METIRDCLLHPEGFGRLALHFRAAFSPEYDVEWPEESAHNREIIIRRRSSLADTETVRLCLGKARWRRPEVGRDFLIVDPFVTMNVNVMGRFQEKIDRINGRRWFDRDMNSFLTWAESHVQEAFRQIDTISSEERERQYEMLACQGRLESLSEQIHQALHWDTPDKDEDPLYRLFKRTRLSEPQIDSTHLSLTIQTRRAISSKTRWGDEERAHLQSAFTELAAALDRFESQIEQITVE